MHDLGLQLHAVQDLPGKEGLSLVSSGKDGLSLVSPGKDGLSLVSPDWIIRCLSNSSASSSDVSVHPTGCPSPIRVVP